MFDPELHLYEVFIGRREQQSFLKASLYWVGLKKSKGEGISGVWQASARRLLNRIFQKWSPPDKCSTDNLCGNLERFNDSLGLAHIRVLFPDASQPPAVAVCALKTEFKALVLHLVQDSLTFFLFTGIRDDFRDFGSHLKRRINGETSLQPAMQQPSLSRPVSFHSHQKMFH